MRASQLLAIGLGAAAAVSAAPRAARACATCQCGDPTLTVMGAGKPFDGRLRVSAEVAHRTDDIGTARVDRVRLTEQRLDLGAAYAVRPWLFVSVRLPVVHLAAEHVNLARDEITNIGDAELRVRGFVWQDRGFSPHHLIAVHGGVELPTGPEIDRMDGLSARRETQPGSGSFDPLAGASYGYFSDPWSAYVSATAMVPTTGYDDTRAGASLLTSVAAQYQPTPALAFRLGVDTRLEAATREMGNIEPDSGGFIAFGSPQLVYSPVTDLLLTLTVRVPVVNKLTGDHVEGPVAALGVTYDL